MNKWKKAAVIAGATALTVGLAACGSNDNASGEADGVTTLLMYQVGDKPDNYDQLMEIANKRIEEKISAKIDLQYISWGDWNQKMSTIIASGENYDLSFASDYVANAQKGAYTDLTELAPEYAKEAYEQLDEAYIKGNSIDGKLYAFPVNGNIYAQQMLTFNKQYLDKYDIDISSVHSYADAEEVLKIFHKNEPGIPAFAIGQTFELSGNFDYIIGKEYPFAVKLDGDTTKIVNQYADKEQMENFKLMHQWYTDGLIPADAATNTTGFPLEGNTWFMREETQGPMDYGDTILTNAAGQELVSRPITIPLKSTAQAQMANFVISNVSKNKEKAMEFLGLLNSDPELLNGLVYGVEGEAWEKIEGEDNKIKLLDGYQPNNHMAAWNTGNNLILYTQDTITDEMIKERDENIAASESSPILGFNFKTDAVKTEITNIANVMNRYKSSLATGTIDPEVNIPKLLEDLKTAGWDKVCEEMQQQFDEFRKTKK
ncbi:ABC transporter substrate-binding protein [Enterococcus sp. CWB-B31]|uniref:ABC transporter substrate-binding protein n=1 Tax=Enterococcus sp. CWB-B31 TaxID=2885159 RepID=UPI001E30568B|nr:ABC transporter substrate-binding protein [Enterococcus sp. CWB-B31]MCB5954096.1 ABC transporter substrate-binding protein [Enterococcus sp. CWB-B31]